MSSSVSRSAETAAAPGVMVAAPGEDHAPADPEETVRPCRPVCANRLPPASSCSCRNQPDGQGFHHRDGLMELRSAPERTGQKQLLRCHAQPRHRPRQRRHQDAQVDSGQARVLEDNGAQDVPIGTTVPSSRHCEIVHRKSSARKFTSSARTTIHWPRRPGDSPANRKTWCCRQAWRARPSREPNKRLPPNQWRPCASAAKKPPGSDNVVGPWSCVLPVKPSRSDPR